MKSSIIRSRKIVPAAMAFAMRAFASVALAQENQPTANAPEASTERVIVTGSYIPTAETESALPVTVYTAEVFEVADAFFRFDPLIKELRDDPSFPQLVEEYRPRLLSRSIR